MLGKLVADSGGSTEITTQVGRPSWGLKYSVGFGKLMGFIVGIPCSIPVGFVILIPLIFKLLQLQRALPIQICGP